MAKKKIRKRQTVAAAAPVEARRAEVVTVGWMLATMSTLGAEVVGGLLRVVLGLVAGTPASLQAIPNLMLFMATVTGFAALVLTPLVYRFRHTPPPTAVTVFAVTVSILPIATGILLTLR